VLPDRLVLKVPLASAREGLLGLADLKDRKVVADVLDLLVPPVPLAQPVLVELRVPLVKPDPKDPPASASPDRGVLLVLPEGAVPLVPPAVLARKDLKVPLDLLAPLVLVDPLVATVLAARRVTRVRLVPLAATAVPDLKDLKVLQAGLVARVEEDLLDLPDPVVLPDKPLEDPPDLLDLLAHQAPLLPLLIAAAVGPVTSRLTPT